MSGADVDGAARGRLRFRVVDAFAERAFTGNPAGVVLLEDGRWPPVEVMRSVAAEFHLSEVAFARPASGADADWELRWFTPVVEEDLCGHATLATAHVIAQERLGGGEVRLRFATRSGVLPVRVHEDGAITLDFPLHPTSPTDVPEGLAAALGAAVVSTWTTGALRDLLVVVETEAVVRSLVPDMAAVAELTGRLAARGVVVTAAAQEDGCGYDFVSRYFAPADGIPEDPVTGSAHTALAAHWSRELGRCRLRGFQASSRGGLLDVLVAGGRVELTGRAVTVLDGALLLEA